MAQQGRREIEQWVQAAAYLEGQTHPVIDLTEEDLAIWVAGQWTPTASEEGALDSVDRALADFFERLFAQLPGEGDVEVYVRRDAVAKAFLSVLGLPVPPGVAALLGGGVTWRLRRRKDGRYEISRKVDREAGIGVMEAFPGVEGEIFLKGAQEVSMTWTFDPTKPHEMKTMALAMLYPGLLEKGASHASWLQRLPWPPEVKDMLEDLEPTGIAFQGGVSLEGEVGLLGLDVEGKEEVVLGMEIRRDPDTLRPTEVRTTLAVELEGSASVQTGLKDLVGLSVEETVVSQAEVTVIQPVSEAGDPMVEIRVQMDQEEERSSTLMAVGTHREEQRSYEVVLRLPLEGESLQTILEEVRRGNWAGLRERALEVRVLDNIEGKVTLHVEAEMNLGEVDASLDVGYRVRETSSSGGGGGFR